MNEFELYLYVQQLLVVVLMMVNYLRDAIVVVAKLCNFHNVTYSAKYYCTENMIILHTKNTHLKKLQYDSCHNFVIVVCLD